MFNKALQFITGIWIFCFGAACMITSGLGAGSWDSLFVGLSITAGLSAGTWVWIIQLSIMVILALFFKVKPSFLSIMTIFLVGLAIDTHLDLVLSQVPVHSLKTQWIMYVSGLIILGFGVAAYLQADFAKAPIDTLMMTIHERSGLSMAKSKICMDIVVATTAFFLNGPVGIGTVICVVLIGPLMQFFYQLLSRRILCPCRSQTRL